MSEDPAKRRIMFAEEIQAACKLRSAALVEALASVPRERFLRPGPWQIRGEGDRGGAPRRTPDADPGHVYQDVSIAIDPARQLFNGAPGTVAPCIDALDLGPGDAVLHVGCGPGYYTALLAHCVGPTGRVVAIEIDHALADEARRNLAPWAWVEARPGDGTDTRGETFDAILINAGMSHPHAAWLQALRPRARLVLPLTCTMEAMGPSIGKGFVLRICRTGDDDALAARVLTMVAIYSAVGIRDPAMNDRLGKAFMASPWPSIDRVRRDAHRATASCWLHAETFCLGSA